MTNDKKLFRLELKIIPIVIHFEFRQRCIYEQKKKSDKKKVTKRKELLLFHKSKWRFLVTGAPNNKYKHCLFNQRGHIFIYRIQQVIWQNWNVLKTLKLDMQPIWCYFSPQWKDLNILLCHLVHCLLTYGNNQVFGSSKVFLLATAALLPCTAA